MLKFILILISITFTTQTLNLDSNQFDYDHDQINKNPITREISNNNISITEIEKINFYNTIRQFQYIKPNNDMFNQTSQTDHFDPLSKHKLALAEKLKSFRSDPPFPSDPICEQKTDVLLAALINGTKLPPGYEDVSKFVLYSGILGFFTNYGDYEGCNSINDIATYHIMGANVDVFGSGTPMALQSGICYFKECDTAYLYKFTTDVAVLAKKYFNYTLQPQSLYFINPKDSDKVLKDENRAGLITWIVIFAILIILPIFFCVWTTIMDNRTRNIKISSNISSKISNTENTNNSKDPLIEKDSLKNNQISDPNIENKPNISSTAIDLTYKKSLFYSIISCFDFVSNFKKIFSVDRSNKIFSALAVFDGVRVLSICYVVIGHSFSNSIGGGIVNLLDFVPLTKTVDYALLVSGLFAVDVFFYLSGFLFHLGLQKYLNRSINKCKILGVAITSRYIRLLPLYLIAIFPLTYIGPWVSSGVKTSIYNQANLGVYGCRTYWWQNLLYINNFREKGLYCVGVAWYLANDMQFFLISIIIFIVFNNKKWIRDLIMSSMMIGAMIATYVICHTYKLSYNDSHPPERATGDQMNVYYVKPYTRITTYILGLYFAELFMHTELYISEMEKKNLQNLQKINKESLNKAKIDNKNKIDSNNKAYTVTDTDIKERSTKDDVKFEISTRDIKDEKDENQMHTINLKNSINDNYSDIEKASASKKAKSPIEIINDFANEATTNPLHSKNSNRNSLLYKFNNCLQNNDFMSYLVFIIALLMINFAVLSTYYVNTNTVPMVSQYFLQVFCKVLFVIGLGLTLHLTFLGRLTWIYHILSCKIFTPMARVTYGVYLTHFNYILYFFMAYGSTMYVNFWSNAICWVGFVIISYPISFGLSLLVESPVVVALKRIVGSE